MTGKTENDVTQAKLDALAARVDLGFSHVQTILERLVRDIDKSAERTDTLEERVRALEQSVAENRVKLFFGSAVIGAVGSAVMTLLITILKGYI